MYYILNIYVCHIFIHVYIYIYIYMSLHMCTYLYYLAVHFQLNMVLSKITQALVTQNNLLTYIVFKNSMHCLQIIIQAKPAMSLCLYSLSIIITCGCTNVIIQDKLWYFTVPFAINPMSFYSKYYMTGRGGCPATMKVILCFADFNFLSKSILAQLHVSK